MRILEVCPFSAGVCGVWTRVREEATRLAKEGHDVHIFSSYFVKGTMKQAPLQEITESVPITRFPATFLGGESFMKWNYEQEALAFRPDLIIVHNYRQPHTTKALSIARKLRKQGHKVRVFLVTHAPFVEGNITRSWYATLAVKFYDFFIGPNTLNQFDKILTISHWEQPFLEKMGVKKEKIVYIPNGIPEAFFTQKKSPERNKVLFLGRISPKKKLDTLIKAIPYIADKNIEIEIVGPQEEAYFKELEAIIKKLNVGNRITFSPPIYDIEEKIKKLDSATLFVLPSRVEGMPQSLIEAMARGKIVIGSNSMAIRDLIVEGTTGYLFEFDNPQDLAKKINNALQKKKSVQKNAQAYVQQFSWPKVMEKIKALL